MIRKVLLSSVALVAISGTAFAADLPSRRAPPVFVPPPIPVFTWTGLYVGAQLGYEFGRDSAREVAVGAPLVGYNVGNPTGVVGGGHVGYNFSTQSLPVFGSALGGLSAVPFLGGAFGANGVVGIEGDVNGSDYSSQVAFFPGLAQAMHNNIDGSVRGRLGIAVDRALFYATGGAAFASIHEQYASGLLQENLEHTRVGYTVGGGVEYAITTQFALRVEYRYTDYGRFADLNAAINAPFYTTHHDINQRVQVGFDYKFDNPIAAPVVARY